MNARGVLAIASLTIKEAARHKVFVNLAVFAAFMVGLALMLTGLTIGQHQRVIHSVSFSVLALVGNLIAIFLGAGLIANEVERKTLYTIVSRPMHRANFVLGRYLGLATVIFMNTALGALLTRGILWAAGYPPYAGFTLALILMFAEMLVVLALSVLFSSFSTPTLSATFTFCFWVIGRMSPELIDLLPMAKGGGLATLMRGTYAILPNLARFDPMRMLFYGDGGSLAEQGPILLYGFGYSATLLLAACWVFSRRDLK